MAKQGKFAKKKKKSFVWFWMIPALLILCVAGWSVFCGMDISAPDSTRNETTAPSVDANQEPSVSDPYNALPQESGAVHTSEATENESPEFTLTAPYEAVLKLYQQALKEDWDFIECEKNQISYMVIFLENLDSIGYYLADLDDNGTPELILSDGNVIYDLYTQVDGQTVRVLSGGERNSYNLCDDGLISNNGASSAASHLWNFYRLEGDQLVLIEAVIFEGSSEGITWKLTEGNGQTCVISEDQANMVIARHRHISIPLNPIS